jgi:PAS domain S-box-containing protein
MVQAPRPQIDVPSDGLASIIESFPDPIIGITSAGVISICNRAAARLYGYPQAELIGAAADILVPAVERAQEAAILRRVAAGEDVGGYRTQRLRRDGTLVAVSSNVSPILDSAGRVTGAVITSYRVRQPRTAERYAGPIDDPSDESVAEEERVKAHADAEYERERSQVQDAQDRFQVRMGEERAKERIQVYAAQDRFQLRMSEERAQERVEVERAQERFEAVMGEERAKERVQVYEAQERFQLRMGVERADERVQVQEGQDRFKIAMEADRVQAQHDREHLQAQHNQSERLAVLGQLAGGVAHDFNNLLAVILNYAAFVAEDLAGPDTDIAAAGNDVAQIQRAAERAADLTHQLLAFARREVIRPRVLDLNRVVSEVEQLLRRTIGADVLLEADLAADLWPVLADPGQMEQVLVNLAINARDAMSGGGTLRIDTANVVLDGDTEMMLRPGRHVRLRISDTGTGMPPEVLEHVFEPFFTTKAEGAGTGLGLSTVYGIVTQTQGAITILSQPGVGTTFMILLPITDEVALPEEEAAPYERTPSGETVLIVEDAEALREVTVRIFVRGGYHVLSAADGAEALALVAEHDGDIHLLITDVVMPKMLGKEVAERVVALKPDIQVLFMSGYAQPVLAAQGRLDRDVHLIEKPFAAAAIIETAGRILHGHTG